MAKEPNWDKINEDKQKEIRLGQAINLVVGKYTLSELFDEKTPKELVIRQIKTMYELMGDAHATIINDIPLEIQQMNKEVAKPKLTLSLQ